MSGVCSVCPSQRGEWGNYGVALSPFGDMLAAAEQLLALGPEQHQNLPLHSGASSLVQTAGTSGS